MRYGLMDIGSNTIHAVVFERDGQKWKKVLSEKEYAELVSYVEEKRLTEDGIDRLCQAIESLGRLFQAVPCDKVIYFGTSALRSLENGEEVLRQVKEHTGVDITVISGQQEAYYDYVSLKQYIKQAPRQSEKLSEKQSDKQQNSALGLDLGGGSGQLFYFDQDKLTASASYEIGCLRLYNNHVSGVLPSSKECSSICRQVRSQLQNGPDFTRYGADTLYVMGGTGRACAKLYQSLQGKGKQEGGSRISVVQLKELLTTVQELGLQGVRIINRLFPERLCSIMPGLLSILTVAEYTGVKQVCIIKEGIREGVLISELENQQTQDNNT